MRRHWLPRGAADPGRGGEDKEPAAMEERTRAGAGTAAAAAVKTSDPNLYPVSRIMLMHRLLSVIFL